MNTSSNDDCESKNWLTHSGRIVGVYSAVKARFKSRSRGRLICNVFACLVWSVAPLCKWSRTNSIAMAWFSSVLFTKFNCNKYPEPNLSFKRCCVATTTSSPFEMIAIRLHNVSASNIICVVIIIARSSVANELTKPHILFRVDGSKPNIGREQRYGWARGWMMLRYTQKERNCFTCCRFVENKYRRGTDQRNRNR